jgi:hypothetical protein
VARSRAAASPAEQQPDTIAERLGVREDVAREEDRCAARLEVENDVLDLAAPDRIETRHRLVENDELRFVDERLGEPDALQHSLRVLLRRLVCTVTHAHELDEFVDPPAPLGTAEAEQLPEVIDELAPGEVRIEVRMLGQIPQTRAGGGFVPGLAEDPDAAGIGAQQSEQAFQRRRLAGAVRPEKAVDLALLDAERDVSEHRLSLQPEAVRQRFGHSLEVDDRHGCTLSRGVFPPAMDSALTGPPTGIAIRYAESRTYSPERYQKKEIPRRQAAGGSPQV